MVQVAVFKTHKHTILQFLRLKLLLFSVQVVSLIMCKMLLSRSINYFRDDIADHIGTKTAQGNGISFALLPKYQKKVNLNIYGSKST